MEYSETLSKIVCHTDAKGKRLALLNREGKVLEFIILPDNDYAPDTICVARIAGKVGKAGYFARIGLNTMGFLPYDSATSPFTDGEKVLVKVIKSAYGIKEAKLTANISPDEREKLADLFTKTDNPSVIKPADNILLSFLHKHGNDIKKIVCDDLADRKDLENFLSAAPDLNTTVEYITNNAFTEYGFDEELTDSLSPCVTTKEGVRLFIEKTQAFWAIDVDSFQSIRSTLEINSIAAGEILRQIRLRNLSGQIVIDFITDSHHKVPTKVINFLKDELKRGDREAFLAGISPLGHVEIIRRRIYPSVSDVYEGN